MSSPLAGEDLGRIDLVALDVDGVLTDGRFYLSDDGVETKAFNTQDGYGIRRLIDDGVIVALISGRASGAVERRAQELGIQHLFLACHDKVAAFRKLATDHGVAEERTVFVGDDVPDIPVLQAAGVAVGVANAHPEVLQICDHVTDARGGHGAVREVCDAVLRARSTGAEGRA